MTRWSIAGGSIGAFTVLASLVYFGLLDNVDSIVGEWARPHDVWGPAQVRADLIVSGLRPVVLASLLAAFTLACCVRRRSLRPAMFVGGVSLVTVALTVATKTAVRRPDPHGLVTNGYGGSFPSGHMVAVVMVLALAILVVRPRPGWWIWLIPAVGGTLMGACLLVQATHWFTDVVGGGLLATSVLAVATKWRPWSEARSDTVENVSAARRTQRDLDHSDDPTWHGSRDAPTNLPNRAVADCYDPGPECSDPVGGK
jgi:membrane-associated phospholipid phosphatase